MKTFKPFTTQTNSDFVHFQSFADKDTLADVMARNVAELLNKAIAERGKASLVVSGGSTPKPFFAALKQQDVDWSKLYVTLADERWVPTDANDSNERLVRETLVVNGMHFIGLVNDALTPGAGVRTTEKALEVMPQPFDVVVLGMGDDGHTASLFPTADALEYALTVPRSEAMCVAIDPPEYAPHPRITLSFEALLHARQLVLHITGESKLKVFEKASGQGAVEDMPIRAFLRQDQVPLDVYWSA